MKRLFALFILAGITFGFLSIWTSGELQWRNGFSAAFCGAIAWILGVFCWVNNG